ncbi:MAG: TonB-dependent receptor [Myxococcales bacterium]
MARRAIRMSSLRGLGWLLGIWLWSAPLQHAEAQTSERHALDELDLVRLMNVKVSTASRTAEDIDDAPAVMSVITYEDIVKWGWRSVAEVLQHTVGFYVLDDNILPNAGVRGVTGGLGAESSVIKVMIDGRPVTYFTTLGNWIGVELVPLESIQQIEIIRGPVSALYGFDAFLGVVNIITRSPSTLRPLRARLLGGYTTTHLGGQFDLSGGAQWGKYDLMLGAAGEYEDRSGVKLPKQSPAPELPSYVGSRRKSLGLQRGSLVLQSRFGVRDERLGHLIASAYASGIQRGGDFAQWAQLSHQEVDGIQRGTTIALGQYRVNLDGLLHVTPKLDIASLSTYFQGGIRPADHVEVASDVYDVERRSQYHAFDSVLEARYRPLATVSAIFGSELTFDREQLPSPERIDLMTQQAVPIVGNTGDKPKDADLFNIGIYVNGNYQAVPRWLRLAGGVRYDHHNKYGDVVTGRFGVISHLPRSITVKLLYGSAFKAPSPYLLYAVPLRPGDVIGNRNLKPQFIHTIEAQVGYRLGKLLEATSALSQSWLLDKAEFLPSGINQAAYNVASQHALAWENRLDLRYRDALDAYLGFDLVYSRRDLGQEGYIPTLVGGKAVVYPPYIGRLGLLVRLPSHPKFPLDLQMQQMLVGPRRAADASIVARGASFTLPTYWLLELSLQTRELYLIRGQETRIALRARNVTGMTGPDPGFAAFEIPLVPRAIMLDVRHTY